jgi:AraC family transcriptional regulator
MAGKLLKINMFLSVESTPKKHFIGKQLTMSFTQNKTFKLWQSFMPRRKEIQNSIGTDLYSMEVYPAGYFKQFNPAVEFEKWAAVEVKNLEAVPADMETLTAPAGQYAVFLHVGPASNGPQTYQYIFQTWLPNSAYLLDDRPHFAVMGEKYKQEDPNSEEEIWIPVKPR